MSPLWLHPTEYAVIRDNGVIVVLGSDEYVAYGDYPNLIINAPLSFEEAIQLQEDLLATGHYTLLF